MKAVLLLVTLLLAGCAAPSGLPTAPSEEAPTEQTTPTATPTAPSTAPGRVQRDTGNWERRACVMDERTEHPPLVGLTEDEHPRGLAVFRWNGSAYAESARMSDPHRPYARSDIETVAGRVVVTIPGGSVALLDANMSLIAKAPMANVTSLDISEGVIYATSDRLRTFSMDLEPLGDLELPLKPGPQGKIAHDVTVVNGTAYLLDDIIMPLYILSVDVRNVSAPVVLHREAVSGQHLVAQWVDESAGRWYVVDSAGFRLSSREMLYVRDLEGAPIHEIQTASWSYEMTTNESSGSGASIVGAVGDGWVLAGGWFGKLTVTADGKLELCGEELGGSGWSMAGDAQAVVLKSDDRMVIVDLTSGAPVRVFDGAPPRSAHGLRVLHM